MLGKATGRAHSGKVLFSRLLRACLLLLLLLPAPAQAAEKGTVPDVTWGASRSDVDRTVALMSDAGARWARLNVSWAAIEPNADDAYDPASLADLDYAVAKVRAAGIAVVMPVADSVPFWASGDPGKVVDLLGRHWDKRYRPSSMADYADFFAFVAGRYAPAGVHVYEVWNEPNLLQFWPSGVNAAEYKLMLQSAYGAIKSADPQATVLVGGLSQHDRDFLAQLYAAGARPYFDAVGDHTYPWGDPANCWNDGSGKRSRDTICGIEEVRRVMEANGDAAKQIWITEMGWSTYNGSGGVTEAQQADYLVKAYRRLESYPYVRAALQYSFRNVVWRGENPYDYGAHFGLLRIDFSRKPAYDAFKGYTPGAGSTTSPTGKKRSTKTTLDGVRRVHGATASRRAPTKLLRGRVRGARSGRVTVRLERRGRHGTKVVRAKLRHGRFKVRVRVKRGRWVAVAEFRGSKRLEPSSSKPRSFRA